MSTNRFSLSALLTSCVLLVAVLAPGSKIGAQDRALVESPPPTETRTFTLLDAVALTLSHDPNIELLEARLDASRGALMSARGRFDPVLGIDLQRDDLRIASGEDQVQRSESWTGRSTLSYETRSGLLLTPSVSLDRNEVGAVDNSGTVAFSLRQPLLRGRGADVVAAQERAATVEVEASYLDLQHTIAQRLRLVAELYWRLRAAQENLDILLDGEARSRTLMQSTRRLIEADLTPAADLIQLQADLAARIASRIGGEEFVFAARQLLGREMGLEPRAILALPRPTSRFPTPDIPPEVRASTLAFVERAYASRADLRASRLRSDSARILEVAAEDALKPDLDLIFTPSYSGFSAGDDALDFFSPLWREVPGLSASLGLSFTLPIGNHRAAGQLMQQQAARRQSDLQSEIVTKALGADIPAAVEAVVSGASRLTTAREAVALFEQAVENEEKKQQVGRSTLLDVLNQRDRLTSARQRLVDARLTLALALLDLRFETGTLWTAPRSVGPWVIDSTDGSTAPEPPDALRLHLRNLTTLPPPLAASAEQPRQTSLDLGQETP